MNASKAVLLAVAGSSVWAWNAARAAAAPTAAGTLVWPTEWTVFLPLARTDPVLPKDVLATVPESIQVSGRTIPARRVTPEQGIRFDFAPLFGGVKVDNTAYAFLVLEAGQPQQTTLGMGADWWLQAWLNGERIEDTEPDGNVAWPPSIHDFKVNVTLRPGRNVLAVRFISGQGSSVLALGGPEHLRASAASRASEGLQVVPNGGAMSPGSGDPFIPAGWNQGTGAFAFQAGELKPSPGTPAQGSKPRLEIDTLKRGAGKGKLYTRLEVDINTLYDISFEAEHVAGEYISISVRNAIDGSATSFIQPVGAAAVYSDADSPNRRSGERRKYKGAYYFDSPRPYLVVEAHGPVRVLLDHVAITALVDHKRAWGSFREQRVPWTCDWQRLSEAVRTPHTPWAKPYAGGVLTVTTIMPRFLQRWSVELAQRFSVTCQPVTMPTHPVFQPLKDRHGQFDDPYWIRGRDGEPELFLARREALKTLSAPADCLLLVRGYSPEINEALAASLRARVEAGAGLVVFGLSTQDLIQKGGGGAAFWAAALTDTNRDERGADFPALGPVAPGTAEAFFHGGKGRIAVLEKLPVPGSKPDGRGEFEMQMSYLMKAMLWAAGKPPSVRLEGVRFPGAGEYGLTCATDIARLPAPASVCLSAALSRGGRLSWNIDDFSGRSVPGGEIAVRKGQREVQLELPRLPAGEHWLHLILRAGDGQTLDWTTAVVKVTAEVAIRSVTITPGVRPHYRVGDTIAGKVELSVAGPVGCDLKVRLKDADGNVWTEKSVPVEGRKEVPFALQIGRVTALMHEVEAELADRDGPVAVAGCEIAIERDRDGYDNTYSFQLWHVPGHAVGSHFRYLGHLVAEEVRQTGVDCDYNGQPQFNAYHNIRSLPRTGAVEPGHASAKLAGDIAIAPERSPCLSDPAYRQKVAAAIAERGLPKTMPYAPLAYELGSEANILGYGAIEGKPDADVCFCQHCLASFRTLMRQEYASLAALNTSWGTHLKDWAEVQPIVLAEAIRLGQLARWIDHRRHMDRVFADFWRYKLEVVRSHDPEARAVADNLREATSYSGVDYWLLFREVVSGSGLPLPYLLSFVPADRWPLTWHRYAYWHPIMVTPDDDLFRNRIEVQVWTGLFQGMHGSSYYTEIFLGDPSGYCPPSLMPDLRHTEYNRWSTAAVAQIRTGLDRLVFDGRREDGGIALLYSRASEHASTAWQKLQGGTVAEKLGSARQSDLFAATLKSLGHQYRAIAAQQVADGELTQRGTTLLILPFSQAMDPACAARIRQFVAAGGTVLADIRPAVGDLHGSVATRGQLDDVFGIQQTPAWDAYAPQAAKLELRGTAGELTLVKRLDFPAILGQKLGLSGAASVCTHDGIPLLVVHRHGAGRAILLNFTPITVEGGMVEVLGDLLPWLGLKPLFGLEPVAARTPERTQASAREAEAKDPAETAGFADAEGYLAADKLIVPERPFLAQYQNGAVSLFAFWWSNYDRRRGAGTERVRVTPPRAGHVYDVKSNRYLGQCKDYEVAVPRESVSAYAVVPYRIAKPRLSAHAGVSAAGNRLIRCQVRTAPKAAAADRLVVRLRLLAPDGSEWRDFAENLATAAGVGAHDFVLPLNAPRGKWTVEAREAISGLAARDGVRLD